MSKPKITAETREKMRQSLIGKKPKNLDWLHSYNKGKTHGNWKGDSVKNGALHDWVRRWNGRPQKCAMCQATKEEKRLTWANKDHKYRRKLSDYISLCYKCHQAYDKEHNNWKSKSVFKKGYSMPKEVREKISKRMKEIRNQERSRRSG